MTRVFQAKTKTGQTMVYCIADGRRGEQALRELERQCEGGTITKVPREDALITDTMHGSNQRNTLPTR